MNTQNESLMNMGTFHLPGGYSTVSHNIDFLFYVLLVFTVIVSILMFLTMFYFLFKFLKTKKNKAPKIQFTENHLLEFTWTFVPFVIVMIIFYWGFKDYLKLTIAPENSLEIHVEGQMWAWNFSYPQFGAESPEDLYVPLNEPVKLVMYSKDVLHSFFIPNFRVKRDVVPNRYSNLWFEATKEGSFQIFCTEYCGDRHSNMLANLHVLPRKQFDEKMEELASAYDGLTPAQIGKKLYKKHSCNTCHSIDGSVVIGPSWLGLYGSERHFTNAESLIADENYIRESILYPSKKVVEGYRDVMNSYAGMKEEDLIALIEYMKTLK
ncbi:cytochrome c oxidase subunit II [Candidatus Marinamargulisbacteria bacterium SCGC AG-414-C22]|nr:cytochrome c oxidase subunit II [Candidatus Marinamargulisbacteria bacterium SCGC AG-414-C22]